MGNYDRGSQAGRELARKNAAEDTEAYDNDTKSVNRSDIGFWRSKANNPNLPEYERKRAQAAVARFERQRM
ncbi:hypothetical protein KA017_02155 [Candidatus Woesebacteria bacterium]|nr:hypothetical protein [Candidatus Woesebacteria bacterium]